MSLPPNTYVAIFLTTIAGLSTTIGGLIAYFFKKPNLKYLAFSLGFSGGVMIYISFMELLPEAIDNLGQNKALFAFFVGIAFIGIIDAIVPEAENPHHYTNSNQICNCNECVLRTGTLTALAIAIHNFPEGIATFGTALNSITVGIFIAIAISIHNIPEGISVSIPIYCATEDKNKALKYSFLSGIAEPIGAIVGFLILYPFLTDGLLAAILGLVSGIMVYISLDELIPMAYGYGYNHTVVMGIVLGMAIMAFSLLII